jgi:hypothetical protein
MTQEQRNEYMSSVRWTTLWYFLIGGIPIIVAGVWFLSGIKADIVATRTEVKDARTESREQLTAAVNSINKRIDSIQYKNNSDIQGILMMIGKSPETVKMGMYTQRMVNGKLVFIPYK